MGQRLEPWSQALSRFKRTLENKFQEYVIHFECYPPLLLLLNPLDFPPVITVHSKVKKREEAGGFASRGAVEKWGYFIMGSSS